MKAPLFVVAGAALLIAAVAAMVNARGFLAESLVADGEVVGLDAGGSHPEIAFTTRRGERVRYPQGGWIAGYAPGDRVRVRYREGDPARSATLDRVGTLFFWPLAMAALGGGVLLAGLQRRGARGRR